MALITLSDGTPVLVSDGIDRVLRHFKWHKHSYGYAQASIRSPSGRFFRTLMHRLIIRRLLGPGDQVDHVNGNKLDNRNENLRVSSHAQQQQNRPKLRTNKSGFKGVFLDHGRWRAKIVANGVVRYLGLFETPELAHEAYCVAAKKLHGDFARTS